MANLRVRGAVVNPARGNSRRDARAMREGAGRYNLHSVCECRDGILVEGRVQGVGFRFFAEAAASREGLNGWVKNRPDGRVEILAGR